MTLYLKIKKAIKYTKILSLKLYNFLKPYNAVVITFKFNELKDVQSPAKIYRVNNENIDDALIYEPPNKVNNFGLFLEQGDWGYYAYIDNKWVHRSWVTFGFKTISQWNRFANLNLEVNEAQIRWSETSPEARGKNVYPAVLRRIAIDLLDKVDVIYISTTRDNLASQRGILKAGFLPVKETKVFSFLGITYEKTKIMDKKNLQR